MQVTSKTVEVRVSELEQDLASFISRAENGEEIVVTSGGKPVARISAVADGATRLAELVEEGIVRPPTSSERCIPSERIKSTGSVSDLVIEQRR